MPRRVLLGLLGLLAVGCAATDDEATGETDSAVTSGGAYAKGLRHSKMTEEVVDHLQQILVGGRGSIHRFAKVGDSITASTDFATCLATTRLDDAGLEATRTFFEARSYDRRSKAAEVGWHTTDPLEGSPSPLARELAETKPAIAIVMLGTNDTYAGSAPSFRANLAKVVDALVAQHVIPVLSTLPPSTRSDLAANAPAMNDAVRAVAQEKKVPLMDLYGAMFDLPSKGISTDKVHPNVAARGACDFSAAGLSKGYNVRTKLTLEALARVKRFVLEGDDPEP